MYFLKLSISVCFSNFSASNGLEGGASFPPFGLGLGGAFLSSY